MSTTEATAASITPLPTPIKGKADWRSYRAFSLENGVTVCLVHDPESKTLSAASTVHVGAAADPRSLSGLAHFCEHMCFLGSEKYPGENEYKQYLAQHGGRSNASTSMHLTTYKFEVLADHAEHAIDIFSNFFVGPLMTESGTGREVNAVDSENSKNLVADVRRRLQILKDLADPDHYYSKFTTGNAETLPTAEEEQLAFVRAALVDFHRKHYRPDMLTVVVAGPQSLDELQAWVVPGFSAMQARDFPTDVAVMTETERLVHEAASQAPPYGFAAPELPYCSAFEPRLQSQWPVLVTSKPVQSMRRLVLMFPLPSVEKMRDQSPASILSHLLGHEGPNSPFAVLQNAGLLSKLSAGSRVSAPDFTLFQVDVGLTEEGEERWKEVVDVLLQHCRLIHAATKETLESGNKGDLHRIWSESATLHAMFFDQTSPGWVYDLAPNLSRNIVADGTAKCLSAGSMLDETADTLPLEALVDFASRLTASNCFLERCSQAAWDEMEEQEKHNAPGVERKVEQWYGVEYFLSQVAQEDIDRWQGTPGTAPFLDGKDLLQLPRPNRYIPRSLELCPDLPAEARAGPRIEKELEPPNLLVEDSVGRLWHRLDDRYALPKSVVKLLIRNAAVEHKQDSNGLWQHDTEASISSSFVSGIFTEAMAQETYDADLAGLHWSLSLNSAGIHLTCSGFSDRLTDLALKVLQDFMAGDFLQESYFLSTRDRVVRRLRTFFESRRADSNALFYRDLLLSTDSEGLGESLSVAESLTLESVKAHHRRLLQNDEVIVDCLYTGNVSEKDAKDFYASASSLMVASFGRLGEKRNFWIPGDVERRLFPGDDVEFHFQSQNKQEENGAVLMTYQSPIPGFRGDGLSSSDSLESTAAMRLISHILREPMFDELRTKQTLGYIVSSYYDIAVAGRVPFEAASGPLTVPVDLLVVNVLSRKLSPPDVSVRIDDFLYSFRDSLVSMPEAEIQHHATALSTKMLKPVQKLGTEASTHFAKISRYGPEVLGSGASGSALPWKSAETLARKIETLGRQDLLRTWDRVFLPQNRARLVSCVYGSTFPLQKDKPQPTPRGKILVVDNTKEVIALRNHFPPYDNRPSLPRASISRLMERVSANSVVLGTATVAVLGATIGWTLLARSQKAVK